MSCWGPCLGDEKRQGGTKSGREPGPPVVPAIDGDVNPVGSTAGSRESAAAEKRADIGASATLDVPLGKGRRV
jgi:hypothetical protein